VSNYGTKLAEVTKEGQSSSQCLALASVSLSPEQRWLFNEFVGAGHKDGDSATARDGTEQSLWAR